MPNLKVATADIMLLCALSGCSTLVRNSSFEIKNETDLLTELLVTPDRVAIQCEELDEEPDVGAYGFMIHLLDEKKTVTTSALSIRPDRENCKKISQRVLRILKGGRHIYIGNGFQLSNQPRVSDEANFRYSFPGHGTFSSNGRTLEFVVIANENGQCFGPSYGDREPCPQFPFPIQSKAPAR